MFRFFLLVYQEAAASLASALPCCVMSLFKMTFELLFTSEQNSRTFVAHWNVFIPNLSIQEQTCLPFKRCCSKKLIKRLNMILIKQKEYNLDSFVWGYHTWTYRNPKLVMKIYVWIYVYVIVEQVMVLRFLSSTDLMAPKKQLNGQKRT